MIRTCNLYEVYIKVRKNANPNHVDDFFIYFDETQIKYLVTQKVYCFEYSALTEKEAKDIVFDNFCLCCNILMPRSMFKVSAMKIGEVKLNDR